MRTADRELFRETRRLVGQTGKVCRTLTWYEGESGKTNRLFSEKWKRAEIDNIIGFCRNSNRKGMTAAELAPVVKEELLSRMERYKGTTAAAAPKRPQKTKKAD